MRVVLDTNVFVSGVFFGGPPGRILEAWRDGEVEVVISHEILEEYVRVGEKLSAQFPGTDLGLALELVAAWATLVASQPLPEPVCRDADDDKFLACALAASVQYIVSGDRDLLEISPYEGITILRPRAFVDEMLERR